MRHFCVVKKLGPDYTFIHCLRVYLLLVSPVLKQRKTGRKSSIMEKQNICQAFLQGLQLDITTARYEVKKPSTKEAFESNLEIEEEIVLPPKP